ncbi:hypothetical protein AOX55_00006208 (plasmid) [Sinorhizobium fredii CCBAU 25509]|nr:hypothetical protein AOX55_00006208 [Sinorhizobium fredii CCBAU 25509]
MDVATVPASFIWMKRSRTKLRRQVNFQWIAHTFCVVATARAVG